MDERFGTFSSWEILSETVAIKLCDASVFKYNGTNISLYTKWFWDIEDITPSESVSISLICNHIKYTASIHCYQNGLIQMYFSKDFGEVIKAQIELCVLGRQLHEINPSIRFEKTDYRCYNVSFIREQTIENDNQDDLTTIVDVPETAYNPEGLKKKYYTTRYERDPRIREAAIKLHGTTCAVCGFNFEKAYGGHGRDYIEVHHMKPLSSLNASTKINPETDLVCLCSNCHRMIHRNRDHVLSVESLISMMHGYEGVSQLFKTRYYRCTELPAPLTFSTHPGVISADEKFDNIKHMIDNDGVEIEDEEIWDFVYNTHFSSYDHTIGGWLEEITDEREIQEAIEQHETMKWSEFMWEYCDYQDAKNWQDFVNRNIDPDD